MRVDIRKGTEVQVAQLPGVQSELMRRANAMKAEAKRLSPSRTGAYAQSWTVVVVKETNAYRLVNTDWKAWIIEKGAAAHGHHPGTPAHNVATRSISAARGR